MRQKNNLEIPKMIIQIPNPPTASINFFPCFFLAGKTVRMITIRIEPISEAAFKMPNPSEPTFKISLA